MTFISLENLFNYAKRPRYSYESGYIVYVENLPPRKLADGKLHEKVNGDWEVVKKMTESPAFSWSKSKEI